MSRLIGISRRRHGARHPLQLGLAVAGVALGVAVIVSVDIANETAERAFQQSTEAVTGRATHQIRGGPAGLDEMLFVELSLALDTVPLAPVVEGVVQIGTPSRESLRLIGLDPFSDRAIRPELAAPAVDPAGTVARLLTEPGALVATRALAGRLQTALGSELSLLSEGRQRRAVLVGFLEPGSDWQRRGLDDLLVADIATAQEILGCPGRLTRIDLRLDDETLVERIDAELPPGVRIERAGFQRRVAAQMSRGFRLNLRALSMLAMFVGMFLIYSTTTFSVVQRREEIATLRSLGVTRGQVLLDVVTGAAEIGILGTAIGLVVGALLGKVLVGLVGQTINDLYLVVSMREATVPPASIAKAAVTGVIATVVAALPPGIEATRAPPRVVWTRSALESSRLHRLPLAVATGVALFLIGGAQLAYPSREIAPAFAGLFTMLLGCGLLVPPATLAIAAAVRVPLGAALGRTGDLAVRGVRSGFSRTGVAVAALTVAVAMTVGVGVMIDSFRGTVVDWLDRVLYADIYISPPSALANRNDGTIDPELLRKIASERGVGRVGTVRGVTVATSTGTLRLAAIDADRRRFNSIALRRGRPDQAWRAFREGGGILISEPLAYRESLRPGDRMRVFTDRGWRELTIAGVYDDYATDAGAAMIHRTAYDALWDDRSIGGIAITVADGVDPDSLVSRLRSRLAGEQSLEIRSHRGLKESSLQVFDRTFTITSVLRLLAVIVAFIGVFSSLMALQLERAREFATLRALGMTPRQLWVVVSCQSGVLGLAAGLLAIPVGMMMAWVMVFVINRRSFGWALEMRMSPALLLQAVAIAVVAALLAGIYPSWKIARRSTAAALRSE